MNKTQVAIAVGGYSSEFDISIKSGRTVKDQLDPDIFDAYTVVITREAWYHLDDHGNKTPVDRDRFGFELNGKLIQPDVVFNTIHGTPGEDGHLAAYLDLIGIPQTSTGFYAAALSFNKRDTLSVLKRFDVACATSCYLNKNDKIDLDHIIGQVGLPCFVKPNRAGSSYGISKVDRPEQLLPAIETAFKEDHELIIEQALIGTEVSVGAYGSGDNVQVLPATQIVPQNEFFDYKAKYEGESEEITPARISEAEWDLVKTETARIHRLLNMKGVTRSEFILQDGTPYFLEINTTPGLSNESIIPQQVRAAGLTLQQFFTELIQQALDRK